MIKHIVMWKLKEIAEGNRKVENSNCMKTMLEGLKDSIEQIKAIEVGINVKDAVQAYDVVLYSEFENLEALEMYQKHPEHVKVAEFVGKVVEKRAVVDYTV